MRLALCDSREGVRDPLRGGRSPVRNDVFAPMPLPDEIMFCPPIAKAANELMSAFTQRSLESAEGG